MALIKGQEYSKADLGIRFPYVFSGSVEKNGVQYLFVNIGGNYRNVLQNGGIVHEPNSLSYVVKQDTPQTKTVYVFVRNKTKGEKKFIYYGELDTIKPHDPQRNFLTLK